jgi:predicted amidohydrolase YtcJ
MANVLFTNARILDGSGALPYTGDVLVQGNRVARVSRGAATSSTAGLTVIDAAGATLMPGMCEAHTHFSWNNAANFDDIQRMPTEEHVLWCAHVAKMNHDHGWTS